MDKKCGIYSYRNKINNKRYIGQSQRLNQRFNEHLCISYSPNHKDYQAVIHKAIRKYGIKNFEIEILEYCSPELLNEKEQYWINFYDSFKNGYNSNEGGGQSASCKYLYAIYDLSGNFLKTILGAENVVKELNISLSTLHAHTSGKRNKAKNFLIKKIKKNEFYPLQISPYIRGGKK